MIKQYYNWKLFNTFKDLYMSNIDHIKEVKRYFFNWSWKRITLIKEYDNIYNCITVKSWNKTEEILIHKTCDDIELAIMRHYWFTLESF